MREDSEVVTVARLRAAGLGATSIAQRTGLPRSTVRDWLAGRRSPTAALAGLRAEEGAPPDRLPPEYVYLLGLYLGDGCISAHARDVYRMRVHLDLRYPRLVDECEAALRAVMPRNRVLRQLRTSHYTGSPEHTHVEVSCYSKDWPRLFPQHGPGRKHERRIDLAGWQRDAVRTHPEDMLRGLVHSDGCRAINTGTNWSNPRYSFSNRSEDILGIFRWVCDLLDLHWTVAPRTVYVSRKADVARMDTFIGPKA